MLIRVVVFIVMCSMSAVYNTVAVCIVCFGHRVDCALPSQVLLVIVLHVDFKCQLSSGCRLAFPCVLTGCGAIAALSGFRLWLLARLRGVSGTSGSRHRVTHASPDAAFGQSGPQHISSTPMTKIGHMGGYVGWTGRLPCDLWIWHRTEVI